MKKKWNPPNHGDDSKYIHIRIRSPTRFSKMRTVSVGHGCKQVYGKLKGKDKWVPQNMMIPRTEIKKRKTGILISNQKIKDKLKEMHMNIRNVKKFKTGGSADYRYTGGEKR